MWQEEAEGECGKEDGDLRINIISTDERLEQVAVVKLQFLFGDIDSGGFMEEEVSHRRGEGAKALWTLRGICL